jgi:uncharacterized protein YqhQ
MDKKQFSYGGQAVLEGVMMRGQQQATVAVRHPSGNILCKHIPLDAQKRAKWERLPLLRGMVMLWDMLHLGITSLNFSASVVAEEEEELPKYSSMGAVVLAFAIAIGLFFVLPLILASALGYLGVPLVVREIVEGVLRLGLIVGYIIAVGRMPEIQRVFMYHGAEHKVVNTYEAGGSLTVETARRFPLIHPRCGTSFLIVVAVISFVVFLFFGGLPLWAKIISRVVLIPLIAALAYEFLRASAANYHRPWVRALVGPSLFFQRMTTREPDDTMIATAIIALQSVLEADGIEIQPFQQGECSALAVSVYQA